MNNLCTSSFQFHVEGAAACFRRPEFTEDFVSYDVMPPFVARRMLNSLYLPDGAEWLVRYIEVLNPIRIKCARINGSKGERRALVLENVAYVIGADLVIGAAGITNHHQLVERAVAAQPNIHLGLASFPGTLRLLEEGNPSSASLNPMLHDLGWMLYEIRNPDTKLPSFFRAQLRNGRVDLSDDLLIAI